MLTICLRDILRQIIKIWVRGHSKSLMKLQAHSIDRRSRVAISRVVSKIKRGRHTDRHLATTGKNQLLIKFYKSVQYYERCQKRSSLHVKT